MDRPPGDPHSRLDANVSPNWKPVAGLEDRKLRLSWSDRIWYWLVSLAGVGITAAGVAVFYFVPLMKRVGACLVGVGFVVFLLGSPSRAVRNGYRDVW